MCFSGTHNLGCEIIQALITHVGEIDMFRVLTTKENVPGTCDSACTMAHFLTIVILVARITIF